MNIVARRLFDSARVKVFARKMSTFSGVEDSFGGIVVKSSNEPHEKESNGTFIERCLLIKSNP